jgi:hypothetical protein
MIILELARLEESSEGTFGVLRLDKQVFCMTLEPQDLLNKPNESSIPAQQYLCERWRSPKYGRTWIVKDVPGRTGILIHPGNLAEDTEGCILLGESVGKLRGTRAVKNSGKTFNNFMIATADEEVLHLTIKEAY